MPEPTKIPRPFADSGDKNSIPDSSGGLGFASWQEGFPAITGTPFAQGGVAPKRADFNGIFNALSLATVWQQQGGFYAYDNTTDYEVGNVVEYGNDLYKCITANGPSSAVKDPTDATVWSKVMTAADTAAAYLPLSGGTITGALSVTSTITTDSHLVFNNTTPVVSSGGADHYLRLGNGSPSTLYNSGASLYLYGSSTTGETQGGFNLQTFDGTNRSALKGRPDGTLTWDGKDVLASLGYFFEDFATKSVPNNAITNIGSVTLTKGLYLMYLTAAFANNTNGYRQLHLASSATGSSLSRYTSFIFAPCAATGTGKVSLLLHVTAASATYYINVYQNSGSALNVSVAGYQYMKLREY